METFLEKLVAQILLSPLDKLKDTLIIVPNRRAKLYINKYISQKIEKPIWAAEIISINDFVYQQLGLQQPTAIQLLIKLYEVHKTIEFKNPQEIDQFSNWGELLISDFNDIDLYLAPVDKLFRYLSDVKKISTWELDPDKTTAQEKRYLKFYEGLSQYYTQLHENLLKENLAYQGMAFRLLSEGISNLDFKDKHVYIAGFNALSPSEQNIIKHLRENYNAKVFWDIDSYYFNNKEHEAGYFLRKQLANEDKKNINFISNNWNNEEKQIDIYGIDGNIAQVKFAAQLLDKNILNNTYKADETAIILANEDLMIPMLNSMPTAVKQINLTMSYPLRHHAIYELVNNVIDIYSGHQNREGKFILSIYHKHFMSFLRNPFLQGILKTYGSTSTEKLQRYLQKSNITRFTLDDKIFLELGNNDLILKKLIVTFNLFSEKAISVFDVIIELLQYFETIVTDKLDKTFLAHFENTIAELRILISQIDNIQKVNTIKKWINKVLNQSPLPFSGEPLIGLQIMGMLETRTLDFKNIIILSANERVLPTETAYQSFILYEVKQEFGLPLPRENDAITSYHFYRLLQRAHNINILYDRSSDKMNSGDSSRFIKQLELELPLYNNKIHPIHHLVSVDYNTEDSSQQITIEKTKSVIDVLKKYILERGLSPSSLNNYKKCGYLFYLQKIANLRKDDEVEEQMAYNTQGNIIHETLEEIYLPFVGKQINYKEFKDISKEIKKTFYLKLDTIFGNKNTETGKNYLTKVILENFIDNYITAEIKYLEENGNIEIIGVEERLEKTLNINIENVSTPVNFKGSADRIDRLKSQIRIVDYKTGRVEENNLSVNFYQGKDQWAKMFTEDYDKAFQLMMYAWMYWDNKPHYNSLTSGILSLKQHSVFYPLQLYKIENIDEEHIRRFEADLIKLVEEIFDKEIPFTQRKADRTCSNCDYKTICMRT